LGNNCLPVATPAWDRLCESRQNLTCGFRVTQRLCTGVRCHSKHSAADVAAYCLRVNQSRGCQHYSHANVVSQMNVWHDSNLLDIWGALQTPQSFGDFIV
jgi:hypothetical protein